MQSRKHDCDSTNNSTRQRWRSDPLFVLNVECEGTREGSEKEASQLWEDFEELSETFKGFAGQ